MNSGGLIEAQIRHEAAPPIGMSHAFPPVNSGGLIEARSQPLANELSGHTASCFRR